jgi:hypothetical protein
MIKLNPILGALLCPLCFCSAVTAATYYVGPLGNDRNSGISEEQSFQMVQHGVDRMKSGDTLIVLDGVYTGTLKLKSDITIKAKNPRKAIFSGAETLSGTFEKHAGNIYKIKIGDTDPKQLFYQNEPMSWARWPNMKWSENWIANKKWVKGRARPGELSVGAFGSIKDLDLSGGYAFIRYGKGNSCYSRAIESFDGTVLKWEDKNFYNKLFTGEDGKSGPPSDFKNNKKKTVAGDFFLAGALDLVDSEGEWFAKDGILYFYAPGGVQPNAADVLIKTNDYSICDEEALANVTIQGIDFFATSLKLSNWANTKIIFRDDYFTYIGAEPLFPDIRAGIKLSKPIQVSGTSVGFDHCLFAGGQNGGLKLAGSMLIVRDCVFAENNRHANFQSMGLSITAKGPFMVRNNTFFNNCSDAMRFGFHPDYQGLRNPDVSYNHVFNAGLFNSDVSGAYFPHLTQHWTEFHHNWVHNVKGNGVRLDQAGEEFTVHHNVFWSSKRGMSVEGYGKFNVYNNTSIRNRETCDMIRNVTEKKQGSNSAMVNNDLSFAPISDWNILNNLVQKFSDGVGPSEVGPLTHSKAKGLLHPERAKRRSLPITDRGAVQGNLTDFKESIFVDGTMANLNLVPKDPMVKGGVVQTPALKAEGVTALDSFRGAYDVGDPGWAVGSDWMPYGLPVPKTMAESQAFSSKYHFLSMVPAINVTGLPRGILSHTTY